MSFFALLTGCTGEAKPDIATLGEKMAAINEKYAFSYFDTFVYEDALRVMLSLCSEDDVLLTINTDETGKIININATACNSDMSTDAQKNQFRDFCSAVVQAYTLMTEKEKSACLEALSFDNEDRYFTDIFEEFISQRYRFTFSSNSEYISLDIAYCEIVQTEKNSAEH